MFNKCFANICIVAFEAENYWQHQIIMLALIDVFRIVVLSTENPKWLYKQDSQRNVKKMFVSRNLLCVRDMTLNDCKYFFLISFAFPSFVNL